MKIKVFQKNLSNAVSAVQKAITSRTTLPILEGIYFEAIKGIVRFVGTDLDIGIESIIEADIESEGSVVVPSKLFGDIIRKLPDTEVEISVDDHFLVKIQSSNSFISIQGLPPDDYPELQQIEERNPFEIEQSMLRKLIQRTVFAVATEETRPILTGALFEISKNNLNIVCLDGYRLALRRCQTAGIGESAEAIIPGKALNEISRLLDNDESKVSIILNDKYVLFDMGYTRIVSRLLNGEFINYKEIIPQEYKTRIKLDTRILYDSIERAALLAREGKNNLIKLNIKDDMLVITSNSEIGQAYEEMPILMEGKEMEIAFNARYFLDILKAVDDQEICVDFTTDISPCVVRHLEGDDYAYLLLPVRLHVR